MNTPHDSNTGLAAVAAAKLRAIRTGLLTLHKAVLDAERRRYERSHGRIESAHHALQLVLRDPWFAWVRPIAELIVQADERLADEKPVRAEEVDAFAAEVLALVHQDGGGSQFRDQYHRALQDEPEIVIAHAAVIALLAPDKRQS
jgi:hypothetical protein